MILLECIISVIKRNHELISVPTGQGTGIDIGPGYIAEQEVVLL